MNVLERTRIHRWRTEAYESWTEAEGDAELAMQLFEKKRPPHIKDVPWELILTLVFELFKWWRDNRPQAVMTEGEAAFLGMESD